MLSSALLVAALAVGGIASPLIDNQKRAVEVQLYVEVVTVTVTKVGYAPETTTEAPVAQPTEHTKVQSDYPTGHEEPKHHDETPVAKGPDYQAPKADYAAPAPGGDDYKSQCLYHHNAHRANHSAPALEWDDNLASIAQEIANSCVFEHNTEKGGGGYGQNIAAGNSAAQIGNVVSNQFYNNEVGFLAPYYGQANFDMSTFHEWGHVSQVLWVGTTKLGCFTADCTGRMSGNHFTVCNYKSPGNFGGEYGKNVLPPLGHQVLSGSG